MLGRRPSAQNRTCAGGGGEALRGHSFGPGGIYVAAPGIRVFLFFLIGGSGVGERDSRKKETRRPKTQPLDVCHFRSLKHRVRTAYWENFIEALEPGGDGGEDSAESSKKLLECYKRAAAALEQVF